MTKRKTAPALEPLYTVTEAAALFRVCRETIIRWIYTGRLEAAKVGGHWRITAREIRRVTGQREP
jgi:excisionase family DNA binding protein